MRRDDDELVQRVKAVIERAGIVNSVAIGGGATTSTEIHVHIHVHQGSALGRGLLARLAWPRVRVRTRELPNGA